MWIYIYTLDLKHMKVKVIDFSCNNRFWENGGSGNNFFVVIVVVVYVLLFWSITWGLIHFLQQSFGEIRTTIFRPPVILRLLLQRLIKMISSTLHEGRMIYAGDQRIWWEGTFDMDLTSKVWSKSSIFQKAVVHTNFQKLGVNSDQP